MIECKNCGCKNLSKKERCKNCGTILIQSEKKIPSTMIEKSKKAAVPNTIVSSGSSDKIIPNTIISRKNKEPDNNLDDLFDSILPDENEDIFTKYNDMLSPILNENENENENEHESESENLPKNVLVSNVYNISATSQDIVVCPYCRAENISFNKSCQVCNNPLPQEKIDKAIKKGAKIISIAPDKKTYLLNNQGTIIGRDEGDILFPNTKYISQKHARIYYYQDKIVLADLGTINGTYLKLRKPYLLKNGDIFSIGKQVFQFRLISKNPKNVNKRKTEPLLLESPLPIAKIVYFVAQGGYDISLLQPKLIIGKEAGHIMLKDDASLSSPHASVSLHKNGYILQDMDSQNGTWIRITKPSIVKDGDMFRIGEHIFLLNCSEE